MSSTPYVFNSEYVDALRQGDPETEAHFVDHFTPILLRTLNRKLRSADKARDIRQETFLRVLVALRSGRPIRKPERFEVFVMGVCNNVLRESYRKERWSVPLSSLEVEPIDDVPSADSLVQAKETQGQLDRAFSQLHINQQGILRAMLLDEQNKDEVCRKLGVSRSHLRVLLCRAKKQLRLRISVDKDKTN
jgi:RNA polymerase sigma-70 factor (ECF subfamily)